MSLRYLLIVSLLLFTACSSQPKPIIHQVNCHNDIYSLRSSECLTAEKLLQKIEPYQVIFIGDHHDEEAVQQFVAELITAMTRSGKTVLLANEWFKPADNDMLQAYVHGDRNVTQLAEDTNWTKRVGYDFKNYEAIYNCIRENHGALYGINMSREERQAISDNNTTAMTPDARAFYEELDLNVSAHQQLVSPYMGHCKQSKQKNRCKKRMYRVQVAWDSYMAHQSALLAKRLLHDEHNVLIVFVGAMHLSHGLGVNMRFARESNLPYVTLLPHLKNRRDISNGTSDYIFLYDTKEDRQ